MIVLYILLGISVIAPIYTYALYPYVLRLFKKRSRKTLDNYNPKVSVLIISKDEDEFLLKVKNIQESYYLNIAEISWVNSILEVPAFLKRVKGEVIVVTDGTSIFLKDTISNVIKALSSPLAGCVSGMVRKMPDENGEFIDGANWKYENRIKVLESNIGSLSGANTAIYAIKKEYAPKIIDKEINLDFFIPTYITELGYDVLFEPQAVAYEKEQAETKLFIKHVKDGSSGYRSVIRFWRLLFPRKGSFVFWSHRVMKWLVPFNMLCLLVGCAILSFMCVLAQYLLIAQLLFYSYAIFYYFNFTLKGRDFPGPIGKLSGFASYFVVLNTAWFLGLFYSNNKNDEVCN